MSLGVAVSADVRVLPNVTVQVDEQVADIGPVAMDLNSYLVPLDKSVAALTRGRVKVEPVDAQFCRLIFSDRRTVISLPTEDRAGSYAEIDSGTSGAQRRKVYLEDPPRRMKVPARGEQLMVGLETLAGLLGVGMDVEGAQLSLFTPDYWRGKLGIGPRDGAGDSLWDVRLIPQMGISPPAKTLLISVRPREPAFVQIYALSANPRPLFGQNNFGQPVTHPRERDTVVSRPCDPNGPARAETTFFAARNEYGAYAAVVSRTQPKGDVLDAIRSGELEEGDWCVVGLRQRVTASPLRFEMTTLKAKQTIKSAADASRMPLSLLLQLNGLHDDDRLAADAPLVVIAGLNETANVAPAGVPYEVTDLYSVQPKETIQELARRCGVPASQFLAANPSLPAGAELEPGEVVRLVRPKPAAVKPPPPAAKSAGMVLPMKAVGRAKAALSILQYASPAAPVLATVPRNGLVLVLGKMFSSDLYRVSYGDAVGYAKSGGIDVAEIPTVPTVPPSAGSQVVVREALRYIGTPYSWGGTDLVRGIDCSHFVAAVHTRVGAAVPSPPVHNQEDFGALVHWKPGPVEMFNKTVALGPPPNLASLRPGDRVIFQNDPLRRFDGNHHTGIYVGEIRDPRFGALEHAVVHAASRSGVTVSDLVDSYLWSKYRYAVRGAARRPSIASNRRATRIAREEVRPGR